MRSKLVLDEGLPGFGKTTTARLVHEILTEMNITAQLFVEGDLEHPADYDGVACFTENECNELLSAHEKSEYFRKQHMIKQGEHYFLKYRKIINEYGSIIPDDLLQAIMKKDVYELPFDQNRQLVTTRWGDFKESALTGPDTFVFDCCFIQNPVTMGLIKYGVKKEDIVGYVLELEAIVEPLNPLLIYVEQQDLEHSFRKAVKERPEEWSKGFIEYYTSQGYGQQQGYKGLEGTLQVLEARREVEQEIYSSLKIHKEKVDNSSYNLDDYKQNLAGILARYII